MLILEFQNDHLSLSRRFLRVFFFLRVLFVFGFFYHRFFNKKRVFRLVFLQPDTYKYPNAFNNWLVDIEQAGCNGKINDNPLTHSVANCLSQLYGKSRHDMQMATRLSLYLQKKPHWVVCLHKATDIPKSAIYTHTLGEQKRRTHKKQTHQAEIKEKKTIMMYCDQWTKKRRENYRQINKQNIISKM